MRCTRDTKILRPERCAVLDGEPCTACTEDIELEKEIKELEDQIEKIHAKRRALRTVMNENHDQLIARFPPEIASQIFIHYAPPDESQTSTPLYLGAVCQKWRQLAWGTHQLWSSLFVRFKPDSSQLLAEYLERSANLPLTLSLFSSQQTIDDEVYLEAINILNRHSLRWHVLDIALPARHLHHLCGSPEGSILNHLVLQPDLKESTEGRDAYDVARFSMKCKPSPMHLTLAKYRLANVDILWNRLTTATMKHIAVDQCLELMRRAPLLEILSLFEIIRSSDIFPIPTARIVLPQLHSLGIRSTTSETLVAKILDSMCAPSLKHWKHQVSGQVWENPPSPSTMLSFIGQSSFSLKSFQVGGSPALYDQLPRILYHLSSLELLTLRFRLDNQSPNDELLNRLCTSDASSPFLPHLHTLLFSPEFTFPWESLPRLFSSSNRRSLTVKVDQQINAYITNETLEKLLKLVDEGFNLSIFREGRVDMLEEYREKRRFFQPPYQ